MNTVKVRAISQGFDGFQRRRPGEVFDIEEKAVFDSNGQFRCKWLELVSDTRVKAEPRSRSTTRKTEPGVPKASDPKAHVRKPAAQAGSDAGQGSGEGEADGGGGTGSADVI